MKSTQDPLSDNEGLAHKRDYKDKFLQTNSQPLDGCHVLTVKMKCRNTTDLQATGRKRK
jgi:hypothetical protein